MLPLRYQRLERAQNVSKSCSHRPQKTCTNPLVPMFFPILGAHISVVEFLYSDLSWKDCVAKWLFWWQKVVVIRANWVHRGTVSLCTNNAFTFHFLRPNPLFVKVRASETCAGWFHFAVTLISRGDSCIWWCISCTQRETVSVLWKSLTVLAKTLSAFLPQQLSRWCVQLSCW